MTEFRDQDLSGARFERSSLRGATFSSVHHEWEHWLTAERDLAALEDG
jgi:hypothetical protein